MNKSNVKSEHIYPYLSHTKECSVKLGHMLLDKYTVYTVKLKSVIKNGLKHNETAKVGRKIARGDYRKERYAEERKEKRVKDQAGCMEWETVVGNNDIKREITLRGGTSEEVQNNLTSICMHTHTHAHTARDSTTKSRREHLKRRIITALPTPADLSHLYRLQHKEEPSRFAMRTVPQNPTLTDLNSISF